MSVEGVGETGYDLLETERNPKIMIMITFDKEEVRLEENDYIYEHKRGRAGKRSILYTPGMPRSKWNYITRKICRANGVGRYGWGEGCSATA